VSKEDTIVIEGTVEEILPASMFKVRLDTANSLVIGYLSGKMRTNKIKVSMGDRVEMTFSPYDLTRGRITRRR